MIKSPMVFQSQGEGSPSVEGQDEKAQAREAYVLSYNMLVSSTCSEILKRYQELSSGKLKSYHPKAVMLRRTVENLQMCDFSTLKSVSKLKLVGAAAKTQYFEMQVSDPAALYAAYESWRASFQSYIHLELGKKSKINPYQASEYNQKIINASNGEWKKLILRIQQTFTVPVEQTPTVQGETQEPAKETYTSPEHKGYVEARTAFTATVKTVLYEALEEFKKEKDPKKKERKVRKFKRIVAQFATFRRFTSVKIRKTFDIQSRSGETVTVPISETSQVPFRDSHKTLIKTLRAYIKKENGKVGKAKFEERLRKVISDEIAPEIRQTFGADGASAEETPAYKNVRGLGLLPDNFDSLTKDEQDEIKSTKREELFEKAVDLFHLSMRTNDREVDQAYRSARSAYLDFVFHLYGIDEASKAEAQFDVLASREVRARKLKRALGWAAGIGAAVGTASIFIAGAATAVASFVGEAAAWGASKLPFGVAGVFIYRFTKPRIYNWFLNRWGASEKENEARDSGRSYESYKAIEASAGIKRDRYAKWANRLALLLAGLTVAALVSIPGAVDFVAYLTDQIFSALYSVPWVKEIVGLISGGFDSLREMVSSVVTQLKDMLSTEAATTVPVPENTPAEQLPQQNPTPDSAPPPAPVEAGPGGDAPPVVVPAEAGPTWPVGIDMAPDAKEGFTQFLERLQGSGPTPEWLKSLGGSTEAWGQWAAQNGLYDSASGTSAILFASDTFQFAPSGALMMHMADGSWQMAISPEGAVQGILKSRMMI